jgi:hypothetical protein
MKDKESEKSLPQREADRRKRQAAALKANIKRRKMPSETAQPPDPDENSA